MTFRMWNLNLVTTGDRGEGDRNICRPASGPEELRTGVRGRSDAKVVRLVQTPHHRCKSCGAFAHLKRILCLGRLRLRGPCGERDEFTLAAIAQNLRKLAKLRPKTGETRIAISSEPAIRQTNKPPSKTGGTISPRPTPRRPHPRNYSAFFNKISSY